ncbi:hypothetical protein KGF56_004606 [Candida oxycetoniae]|uniref:Uncharacterized protein n=1 Tax=Candida oxycetoniae TaxID=497107 RepID=A0AAI9WW94_9ASCO|nr:uncharacterized protein KGF56_004606 [Candida oxycetoniae]KAI3402514.1 hypothetical protein KGF56_004606 [Candida oxycetoniae]
MAGTLSLYAIVSGTLITGAANSLLTKYQDNQCVKHCSSLDDPTLRQNFNQPVIQTLQMFLGEFAMLFVYLIYRYYNNVEKLALQASVENDAAVKTNDGKIGLFQNWRLAIPAICDLSCTTLLNVGLIYTPVSIYQMTRGSVVLFVAVLSVIFLKRKITKLQWASLAFVSLGVAIVGLSGSRNSGNTSDGKSVSALSAANTTTTTTSAAGLLIFGIILIVLATSLQGIQFVVEEHILAKNPIMPLQLVYIEGFFGVVTIFVFMIIFNYIFSWLDTPAEFGDSQFNMIEAFRQVLTNRTVLISSILIMISIAGFNYCGLSITHRISATARSTVDTCRTLIVWIVALIMQWERFYFLQLMGFVVLVFGTLCFNGVLTAENWKFVPNWLKEKDNDFAEISATAEETRTLIEEFEEFENRT